MLCRVTLAVAVVCFCGVCSCVQVDLMSRLNIPRDYGVKLCGREFIRAVIFTCGGSRWRRSTEGDRVPFQWSSLSDITLEDDRRRWQPDAGLPDDPFPRHVASFSSSSSPSSSRSLADLLALYGQHPSLSNPPPLPSVILGESVGILSDEPAQGKKKRNFSLGVAGKCCNHGCTKNDIGRLC
ncbi:prorelaxin H1 [Antennarius striatus]|uniref:prorelaxin H1 n=1 Tax=Antennarius striatus TaxID=241820 RepID=UPI0035AEBEF8